MLYNNSGIGKLIAITCKTCGGSHPDMHVVGCKKLEEINHLKGLLKECNILIDKIKIEGDEIDFWKNI